MSSTSAPDWILVRGQVERAMRARKGRPLFLIDLAVPRDLDPSIHELDGCYLYDIDDLQAVVAETLAVRRREAERAEAIVAAEAERFREWQDDGVLVRTDGSAWYPYEMEFTYSGARRRVRGLVCEVELEPWGGSIVPHERTMPGPIEDRLSLLRAVRANLSPVYVVFTSPAPDVADVGGIIADSLGQISLLQRHVEQVGHNFDARVLQAVGQRCGFKGVTSRHGYGAAAGGKSTRFASGKNACRKSTHSDGPGAAVGRNSRIT